MLAWVPLPRANHYDQVANATGVPPFQWEESAIDALTLEGLAAVKLWTIERIAYQLEAYNGWGYRSRNTSVNTPYLWACPGM